MSKLKRRLKQWAAAHKCQWCGARATVMAIRKMDGYQTLACQACYHVALTSGQYDRAPAQKPIVVIGDAIVLNDKLL